MKERSKENRKLSIYLHEEKSAVRGEIRIESAKE